MAAKKTKGMRIRLGDHETDCLTRSLPHWCSSKKMMCVFKQSTESVGLKNPPRQNEKSEQSKYRHEKKWRSKLGRKYISATGNNRDQKSNQSGLGIVLQKQPRADIKIVLPATQTPLIQHSNHADAELRLWNLDIQKNTKE